MDNIVFGAINYGNTQQSQGITSPMQGFTFSGNGFQGAVSWSSGAGNLPTGFQQSFQNQPLQLGGVQYPSPQVFTVPSVPTTPGFGGMGGGFPQTADIGTLLAGLRSSMPLPSALLAQDQVINNLIQQIQQENQALQQQHAQNQPGITHDELQQDISELATLLAALKALSGPQSTPKTKKANAPQGTSTKDIVADANEKALSLYDVMANERGKFDREITSDTLDLQEDVAKATTDYAVAQDQLQNAKTPEEKQKAQEQLDKAQKAIEQAQAKREQVKQKIEAMLQKIEAVATEAEDKAAQLKQIADTTCDSHAASTARYLESVAKAARAYAEDLTLMAGAIDASTAGIDQIFSGGAVPSIPSVPPAGASDEPELMLPTPPSASPEEDSVPLPPLPSPQKPVPPLPSPQHSASSGAPTAEDRLKHSIFNPAFLQFMLDNYDEGQSFNQYSSNWAGGGINEQGLAEAINSWNKIASPEDQINIHAIERGKADGILTKDEYDSDAFMDQFFTPLHKLNHSSFDWTSNIGKWDLQEGIRHYSYLGSTDYVDPLYATPEAVTE